MFQSWTGLQTDAEDCKNAMENELKRYLSLFTLLCIPYYTCIAKTNNVHIGLQNIQ